MQIVPIDKLSVNADSSSRHETITTFHREKTTMTNLINTLKNAGEMATDEAVTRFGWEVITKAYNKGRITFAGEYIVFVQ